MARKVSRKRVQEAVRQLRRTVAYHEAGHAVTHYLLGEWTEFIEMDVSEETFWKTEGNWARTRCFKAGPEYDVGELLATELRQARAIAARYAVNYLAGACVENIVDPCYFDWLDNMFDEAEEMDDPYFTDIMRAMRTVNVLYPHHPGRRYHNLLRMKQYTEELFAEPCVWSLVEALAAELQQTDYLEGIQIRTLLDGVCTDTAHVAPMYSLGRKWRRRFGLRRQLRPIPNPAMVALLEADDSLQAALDEALLTMCNKSYSSGILNVDGRIASSVRPRIAANTFAQCHE